MTWSGCGRCWLTADAAAHLRRLRGLLLEQRDRADAMAAAIDRELAARAKGETMTPEEQLGMLGARLYDAILEDHVRRAVSTWTRVGPDAERRAVRSLRDDLDSGRWAERNHDVIDLCTAELGLRLLVA